MATPGSSVPVFGRSNSELQRGRSHARRAFEFLQKEEGRVDKQEPLWLASGLRDVKWDEIDLRSFRDESTRMRVFYVIGILFALSYFYDYLSDTLMCYTLIKEYWYTNRAMPVIYFITVAVSVLIFYYDYQLSLRIKNSGDISDTFMNEEALRFASIEYDKFCLIQKVLLRLGRTDRVAKRIQQSLHTWKRLLIVNIPQFVITVVALGLYHQTSLSVFTDSEKTKIQRVKLASYLIKIILLSVDGLVLVIGSLGYPCFRAYISSEVSHLKDVKPPSMRKFVTWRIDHRINQLLGLVMDPQHPERVPVVMIVDANGNKRRMRADELAAHKKAHGGAIDVQLGAAAVVTGATVIAPKHDKHDGHGASPSHGDNGVTASSSQDHLALAAAATPSVGTAQSSPSAGPPVVVSVNTQQHYNQPAMQSPVFNLQAHAPPTPASQPYQPYGVQGAPVQDHQHHHVHHNPPMTQPAGYYPPPGPISYNYPTGSAPAQPMYQPQQPMAMVSPQAMQLPCSQCGLVLTVPPNWPPNGALTCPRCQLVFVVRI